jgi:hypothetical protein
MACKICNSDRQRFFPSEIAVHFPGGLDKLNKRQMLVYPQLLVCLNCGFTEFLLPKKDLRQLATGSARELATHKSRDKSSSSTS